MDGGAKPSTLSLLPSTSQMMSTGYRGNNKERTRQRESVRSKVFLFPSLSVYRQKLAFFLSVSHKNDEDEGVKRNILVSGKTFFY